jgi:hypothetical protein
MDWKLQRLHMKNHAFTREQLLSISDPDIFRWMKHHIYGDEEAAEASVPLLYYRHYTVLFGRKLSRITCPTSTCHGTLRPTWAILPETHSSSSC